MAMKTLYESFLKITKEQSKDTGMAIVLVLLLLCQLFSSKVMTFISLATIILIINMIKPIFYKPVAWAWFGMAEIMGSIVSRILLAAVFVFIVCPVGIFRKFIGKDSLQLRAWKKNNTSVFVDRDHSFTSSDIIHPY